MVAEAQGAYDTFLATVAIPLTRQVANARKADIGKIIGPAFSSEEIVDAVESLVDVYLKQRHAGERFLDTYRRVGLDRFKGAIHATDA